jgi:hypothetical protein
MSSLPLHDQTNLILPSASLLFDQQLRQEFIAIRSYESDTKRISSARKQEEEEEEEQANMYRQRRLS